MAGNETPMASRGSLSIADSTAERKKAIERIAAIEALFVSLMGHAEKSENSEGGAEAGLGGKLLYAGELDDAGCAIVAAGNVAGAATIAATADAAAQRAAVREGVVDFLVNSLDEALRILKNEVRKRQPVAVCVSAAQEVVKREMLERGAQPDILPETEGRLRGAALRKRETHIVRPAPLVASHAGLAWGIDGAAAQWMPKLDALAIEILSGEWIAARWLRHAPRYLGRQARGLRVLRCSPQSAREIVGQFEAVARSGAVGSGLWLTLRVGEECSEYAWGRSQQADEG